MAKKKERAGGIVVVDVLMVGTDLLGGDAARQL